MSASPVLRDAAVTSPLLPRGVTRGFLIPRRDIRVRGFSPLDALLGGGLPCGVITEIVGNASSGRTALGHALVSAATCAGELAVWIDLPDALDPEHAAAAGVSLERILWIRPHDPIAAFRATEYVLDAGGFRLVVLDLDAPYRSKWTIPTSVWLRVVRTAVRSETAVVVLSRRRLAGTFAALSLETSSRRTAFVGDDCGCYLFEGMTTAVHLRKNKLGPPGEEPVDLFASTVA